MSDMSATYALSGAVSDGTTLSGTSTEKAACFARGTLIATQAGEVPVETLQPGTKVTLARGGEAPVRWVGHRRARPSTACHPLSVQPIEVASGALGDGLPHRTLRLSPEHAVFVDGLLVPVGLLVNDRSVVRLDVEMVEYFHVELDRHDIILAERLPVETYLDTGNRSIFANAPLVTTQPDIMPVDPCVPMMFEGEGLRLLKDRLAATADDLMRDRAA